MRQITHKTHAGSNTVNLWAYLKELISNTDNYHDNQNFAHPYFWGYIWYQVWGESQATRKMNATFSAENLPRHFIQVLLPRTNTQIDTISYTYIHWNTYGWLKSLKYWVHTRCSRASCDGLEQEMSSSWSAPVWSERWLCRTDGVLWRGGGEMTSDRKTTRVHVQVY